MTPRPVVCFGEALWDVTPQARLVGGAPLNVALRLAERGVDTIMLSRVGNDVLGHELLSLVSNSALDTTHVQIDAHRPTGVVHVDVSTPGAAKYEIATPAAWDYIDADEFIRAYDGQPGPLVFGSLAARNEVSRSSLLQMLERAPLAICDVNLRPPYDSRATLEKLLERTHWLKLNESELGVIAGWLGATGSPQHLSASICRHYGFDAACVTLGAKGALMYRSGEIISQPGFAVPVVDTIGCGDAFLAGWIAQMLADAPPHKILRHACAIGALAATGAGANAPITAAMIDTLAGSN